MSTLSPEAAEWLRFGEHGISSLTMFNWLTDGRLSGGGMWRAGHPYDLDDFHRCEKLLRQVPELRPLLPRMAAVHPVWALLVERWDAIVRAAESEQPGIFDQRPRPLGRCTNAEAIIEAALDAGRKVPA